MTSKLKAISTISMTLVSIIFSIQLADAGIITICNRYDTVSISPTSKLYIIQNDIWNDVDDSQCLAVDFATGNFNITSANHNKPLDGSPAAYPSSLKGCHWGNCSDDSGMPIKLHSILHAVSGWSTTQPALGAYNVAFDIWFNQTSTTSSQPNGAEVQIWLNRHGNMQPAGLKIAQAVSIAEAKWDVWLGINNGVNIISYVRTVGVTSVSSLDLKSFFADAEVRGYLEPTWYLVDIEAGFEIWQDGTGLASTGFWVLVE